MAVDHRPLQGCVFVPQNLNEAGADEYLISSTHPITINAFMCLLAPQRIPRVSSLLQTQSAELSFSEWQNLCLLCEQLDQQVHLIPFKAIQLISCVYSLYLC